MGGVGGGGKGWVGVGGGVKGGLGVGVGGGVGVGVGGLPPLPTHPPLRFTREQTRVEYIRHCRLKTYVLRAYVTLWLKTTAVGLVLPNYLGIIDK